LIAAWGNGDETALNRVVPSLTPSSGEPRGSTWVAVLYKAAMFGAFLVGADLVHLIGVGSNSN